MRSHFLLLLVIGVLGLNAGQVKAKNPVVIIETSMGRIKVELFADKAPMTVKNFMRYVDERFYDKTIIHKVIPGAIIQCGAFEAGAEPPIRKKTNEPIKSESANGLDNVRGTIAMARGTNADSATSQFFINLKDNKDMNQNQAADGVGFCVFGKVIDGMDVLEKIAKVETAKKGSLSDAPVKEIIIKSIRRESGSFG